MAIALKDNRVKKTLIVLSLGLVGFGVWKFWSGIKNIKDKIKITFTQLPQILTVTWTNLTIRVPFRLANQTNLNIDVENVNITLQYLKNGTYKDVGFSKNVISKITLNAFQNSTSNADIVVDNLAGIDLIGDVIKKNPVKIRIMCDFSVKGYRTGTEQIFDLKFD